MKEKIFVILMLCVQISVEAQQRVCFYDSIIAHKKDIEKLDAHIAKMVKREKTLKDYKDLRQLHIYNLYNSLSSEFSRKDYQDYSFMKKLSFLYSNGKRTWFYKKKLIDSDTYLVTKDGVVVGRFLVDRFCPRWSWDNFYIQEIGKMYSRNQIDFAFCDGINYNFNGLVSTRKYIFVNHDTIFISLDTDKFQLIPLEEYMRDIIPKGIMGTVF